MANRVREVLSIDLTGWIAERQARDGHELIFVPKAASTMAIAPESSVMSLHGDEIGGVLGAAINHMTTSQGTGGANVVLTVAGADYALRALNIYEDVSAATKYERMLRMPYELLRGTARPPLSLEDPPTRTSMWMTVDALPLRTRAIGYAGARMPDDGAAAIIADTNFQSLVARIQRQPVREEMVTVEAGQQIAKPGCRIEMRRVMLHFRDSPEEETEMLVQSGVADNVHFTASRQIVIDARNEPWLLTATPRESAGNRRVGMEDCPPRPKSIIAVPLTIPKGTTEIEVAPYVLYATYLSNNKQVKLSVLDAETGAPVAQGVAFTADLLRPAGVIIGPLHVRIVGTRQPDCLKKPQFQATVV